MTRSTSGHRAVPTLLLPAALLLGLLAAGCGGGSGSAAVAAKVNGDAVTLAQVNAVVAQQANLTAEQAVASGEQALERLIDQLLAVQQARSLKLDEDPMVQARVELARRDVLARAYAEHIGQQAAAPTADEIRRYYDEHPALFSRRRLYRLQELQIEAPLSEVQAIVQQIGTGVTLNDFVAGLKARNLKFTAAQAVRAAEQLPLASLPAFERLQPGQALVNRTPQGAQVLLLVAAEDQPLTFEQARPTIEKFVLNERRIKLLDEKKKTMREAAKIERSGPLKAESAASAPSPAASR